MQPDLFPQKRQKVTLHISGIIPSFKTQKTAYGWLDKATGKIFARPATLPEHREWMEKAVRNFVSQLLSGSATGESTIQTGATPQSLIALLPRDDCWAAIPETLLKSELCEPGQEGATIVIERL
jgi:hypothetical protein